MACCEFAQLQAYYDGELPARERETVESHLATCADCRRVVQELGAMSELIVAAPMAQMPAASRERFIEAWEAGSDRGVLKIAGWLTTAAAAVLAFAVINRAPTGQSEPVATAVPAPALWQTVASMSPDVVEQDDNRGELIVLAQWMADDLSAGEGQRQ